MMIERWFQSVLLCAADGIELVDVQKSMTLSLSGHSVNGTTMFHGHQNHIGRQPSLLSRNMLLFVTLYPVLRLIL